MKRIAKLALIGAGVCLIVMAAKCTWFHGLFNDSVEAACVCVDCPETCEHLDDGNCDCDNDCGCPMCVPAG